MMLLRKDKNSEIYQEKGHLGEKLGFYKLVLIFSAGSFLGVVTELIWSFIHDGYFESRSGLVYGPFNLLYGLGALAFSVILYPVRNKNPLYSFAGGVVVGCAVEYVCSLFQESVFGSRSWDYTAMPLDLHGRICLTYGIYWGFLALLWMKLILPAADSLLNKIPLPTVKITAWVLLCYFFVNSLVTCTALYRWKARMDGEAAEGTFWSAVDSRFPDERMERIFANMEFGGEE